MARTLPKIDEKISGRMVFRWGVVSIDFSTDPVTRHQELMALVCAAEDVLNESQPHEPGMSRERLDNRAMRIINRAKRIASTAWLRFLRLLSGNRLQVVASEIRQESPVGYLVFDETYQDCDFRYFDERVDAEDFAADQAETQNQDWRVFPMFASQPFEAPQ